MLVASTPLSTYHRATSRSMLTSRWRFPCCGGRLSIRMVAGGSETYCGRIVSGCRGLIRTDELLCQFALSHCSRVQRCLYHDSVDFWSFKPRLRYSPGLALTTRLNALLNAASDS